jgi:hypothetical protein
MKLPIAFSLLLLTGTAQAQDENNHAAFPTGEGAPYAITCRPPQYLPGSRLQGPEVCKTNMLWAQYRKDGMDVAADGIHDVPLNGKNGIACSVTATTGGANWTGRMNMACMPSPESAHYIPPPAKPGAICRAGSLCG